VSGHDDRLVRRAMQAAAGQAAHGPCPDAELLGLYAERGLGGDEQPAVEAHVAGCGRCQSIVAATVRSAPEASAAGGGISAGASGTWWQGWRWLVPVTATAVVMLAVWVGRPPAPSEPAPAQEEAAAPAVEARRAPQESAAAPAAAAPPDRQAEPARESAFRAPSPGTERDQLAAGNRQAPPPARPSALGKQAATAPAAAARADAEAPATLADARERTAAAAAPPPAPAATVEGRDTIAVATPATPPVAQQPPAARRAERDAAAKPEEMARAKSTATSANDAGRGVAAGGVTAVQSSRVSGELTGRITYRTRAALPPGAVVEVRLLDASRADAPAPVLGRVEIVARGEQVPLPFAVRFDPEAIDQRRHYTLDATITIAGRVAYRTTATHAVLTNGAPIAAVEVVVEPVR